MKKAVLKLSSTPTSTPFKLGAVYKTKGSDNFYILVQATAFLYLLSDLSGESRWIDPVDVSLMQKELDEYFHLVADCIKIELC